MPKSLWILILVFSFLGILSFFPFYEYFFVRFEGWHIWRQADSLSLSLSYIFFDNPFFEPRLFNLGFSGNGKTGSDFPFLYYWISAISEGYNVEVFYKVVVFSIAISGLISFYKIASYYVTNFQAYISTLFFAISPTYIFYSNNYLMNIPSLSLSMLGLYLIHEYYQKSKRIYLLIGTIVLALAVLLKATALNHVLVIIIFFVCKSVATKSINKSSKRILYSFGVIIGLMIFWIGYISNYNLANNSGMFLTGILPFWEIQTSEELMKITQEIIYRKRELYSPITLLIIPLSLVVIFSNTKWNLTFFKSPLLIILTYLGGFILYLALFYKVLDQHDYYYTNWLIITPLSVVSVFYVLKENKKVVILLYIVLTVILIDGIFTCKLRLEDRYSGWRNEFYRTYINKLESDYTRFYQNNLTINNKIYIPSDPTINASLVTLHVQGWTGYNVFTEDNVHLLNDNNVDFILIRNGESTPEYISKYFDFTKPYLIGEFSTIYPHIVN